MRVGIVGAGIVGLALADVLAERGGDVTLFERGEPGGEASRHAGGILGAQAESHHPHAAFAAWTDARRRTLDWCEQLQREGHGEQGVSRHGVVQLAHTHEELTAQHERAAWQRAAGARVEQLDASALRRELPEGVGSHALGALYFPDDGHLDPPLYVQSALSSCRRRGVVVRAGTEVLDIDRRGASSTVRTASELLAFDRLVVTAGSWSSSLLPEPELQVRPIRGQVIELRAERRPFGPVVFGAGAYSIPRDDGRVTVGATMEDVGHSRGVTASGVASLLHDSLRAAPVLEHAAFVRAWSSFRPFSEHGLLARETSTPGVFVLTGHHRNGILLARATALQLAELLLR